MNKNCGYTVAEEDIVKNLSPPVRALKNITGKYYGKKMPEYNPE